MSDAQQGPDWWMASDGKWYPPEQAPAVPPVSEWSSTAPPPGPPPSSGSSGSKAPLIIGAVVAALVLLVGAIVLLGGDDDDDEATTTTTTVEDGSDTTEATDTTTDDGGSDTTVDGSDEVPDGFEVLEGDGVSIAAPEGWELIDAEDLELGGEDFSNAFPDAPEGLVEQGLGLFENGAILVAFDFSDPEFADNVNVVEIPGEAPLDAIEEPATQQLSSLGGEVIDSGIVELAFGEALRIEYTLAVALPDGSSVPAEGVQYYLPLDGTTYIVTVSTGSGAADLASAMIETFSVG